MTEREDRPGDAVARVFEARYGHGPAVRVRAPGRVNLIGEHTDYNDGFVLPLAIERAVWLALRPRPDRTVRVWSTDYEEAAEFEVDGVEHGEPEWSEYLRGTAWALEEAGHRLAGWEGTLGSDVPIGAGLSSSAALELATARAFAAVSSLPWDPAAMARLAQRAENRWVGVNCGIMDQMISAVGEEGHAVLIDCRTLDTRAVPLPEGTVVVVLDTATRRGLVDSAYNERRRQCEDAAAHFGVPALRDVTPEQLAARSHELDGTTARRARHVVTENARTRRGCHGARMTGAGFGGCAVALVESDAAAAFVPEVADAYRGRTGLEPQIYVTGASAGARVVETL